MEYIEELEKAKKIITEMKDEVKAFNGIMEELSLYCQSGLDYKFMGDPENQLSIVEDIYVRWECIKDKIHFITVFFIEYKYKHIDLIIEQKVKLLKLLKIILECENTIGEYIGLLCQSFFEGYQEYEISGSSGNPANISSLCRWQVEYCKMYSYVSSISIDLYFELDHLYFETRDLEEIETDLNDSYGSLQNVSEL